MKRFFSIIISFCMLFSLFCVPSYAIDSNAVQERHVLPVSAVQQRKNYTYEFDMDLGDSNFAYFIFSPDNSLDSCLVKLNFIWCIPEYHDARVMVEWESKSFDQKDSQYEPMGLSKILTYDDVAEFRLPLYMMRDYRLKITNLDYPNKKFIADFVLTFSM